MNRGLIIVIIFLNSIVSAQIFNPVSWQFSQKKINEEFGDLMFSIVNLGRHLGVDPEEALKQTNRKFTNRFKFVEDSIRSQGKKIEDTHLEEMEALWQQAKDL